MKSVSTLLCTTALLANTSAATASDDVLRKTLEATMRDQVAQGFSGIVHVSIGERILMKEGFGIADRKTKRAFDADTVVDSASVSKQATATAAVRLASEGKLSLSDTLKMYFDDVPADKADITIEQLLSHTGGIVEWAFPDDFTPIPRAAWLDLVFAAPLVHAPGKTYHYSNDGITLVAMIVERVTQSDFRTYMRETFHKPLGMTRTGWFDDAVFDQPDVLVATGYRNGKDDGAPSEWPAPNWALLGNGGIIWNLSDMWRWHQGVHKNMLSDAERETLFRPHVTDPERSLYPSETGEMHYALGWRIGTSTCGDQRISHTGTGLSHNADLRYYKDRDILIYAASNKIDEPYGEDGTFYARNAAKAITRVMMSDCDIR